MKTSQNCDAMRIGNQRSVGRAVARADGAAIYAFRAYGGKIRWSGDAEHLRETRAAAFADARAIREGEMTMGRVGKILPTKKQALRALPRCCVGDVDDAACQTAADIAWAVRLQLDLIEEGQDGTEGYTARDVAAIRRFVRKYGGRGAHSPTE